MSPAALALPRHPCEGTEPGAASALDPRLRGNDGHLVRGRGRNIQPSRRASLLWLASTLLIASCATPVRERSPDARMGLWTGRLALQVEDKPSQSFSAGFELRGQATTGELTLLNPVGGTLAVLSWAPGAATLKASGQAQQFASVDALVEHATGSAIPMTALFDWLAGANTAVPGWKADLSQLGQGRLQALRQQPAPAVDLRVILDR